jgi:hypothetical protein
LELLRYFQKKNQPKSVSSARTPIAPTAYTAEQLCMICFKKLKSFLNFNNTILLSILAGQAAEDEKRWLLSHSTPWPTVEEKWHSTATFRINHINEIDGSNLHEVFQNWPLYNHTYGARLVKFRTSVFK